ncbi:MAG: AraC family transcriptional regulator [Bacteroides sp.]|nr:AraC family transcriptional regulator [Bacteroides sp.]
MEYTILRHLFLYYKINVIILVLSLLSLLGVIGCGNAVHEDPSSELETLCSEAMNFAAIRDFQKADSVGIILAHKADSIDDDRYRIYALIFRSLYPYAPGDDFKERRARLDKALEMALTTGNDSLAASVHVAMGGYSMFNDYDYATALSHLDEASRLVDSIDNEKFRMVSQNNLSELFFIIGDTLGLQYDRELYDYGKAHDYSQIIQAASTHIIMHYIRAGEPLKAVPFLNEMREIKNLSHYHTLKAEYYMAVDSLPEAEKEISVALGDSISTPMKVMANARLLYHKKDYKGALQELLLIENFFAECSGDDRPVVNQQQVEMLGLLAEICQSIGDVEESNRYYRLYADSQKRLFNERGRVEATHYRTRYDLSRKEIDLTRTRAEVIHNRLVFGGVIILLGILFIGTLIYMNKRNRLLSIIVERQKNAFSKGGDCVSLADSNPSVPGISEEKGNAIWEGVMREMNNGLYLNPSLTRDMLAERVGCNHTWLSQIIKERSEKSFPKFINSFRIEVSLRLLSDPNMQLRMEDVWRQSGFLSKGTFYTAFKEEMGMSPAEYRRRALNQ